MLAAVLAMAAFGSVHASVRNAAEEHHAAGIAFHLERCLENAAREYDAALALDPPAEPTAGQRARVLRLVPRVFVTPNEPFALRDVAAILHPSERIVAFHFFWEDDIDFPDDGEPSDHEVAWVRYDASGNAAALSTLFHGRVITSQQPMRGNGPDGRPRIDVQWGKHGPMPRDWRRLSIATEESDSDVGIADGQEMTLLDYNRATWRKLATGTRAKHHPLAVHHRWPTRYEGDVSSFTTFSREIDVRGLLARRAMMLISRWNSGTLARYLILYNFRPKLEWPEPSSTASLSVALRRRPD